MKRGEVTNHKALWVKEELISTLHEFKCEPRGTTRGVADRRVQPVLSPFEYFHQIIRDEMREEIVKSTKCLPTRYAGQRPPLPRLSCGSKVGTRLGESLKGTLIGGDREVPQGTARPRRREEHAHAH